MAELSKKLFMQKGDTVHSTKIYSTTSDLIGGLPALKVSVDGINGYVALDSVGKNNTTHGRVQIGNDVFQVCSEVYRLVSFNQGFGYIIGWADNQWDTLYTMSLNCPSARNVKVNYTAQFWNWDKVGECGSRLLINNHEVVGFWRAGTIKDTISNTVNYVLPAGTNTLAIQYQKPKWTRFVYNSGAVQIYE